MGITKTSHWLRATFFGDPDSQQWCREHGLRYGRVGGRGYLVPVERVEALERVERRHKAIAQCRAAYKAHKQTHQPTLAERLVAYKEGLRV